MSQHVRMFLVACVLSAVACTSEESPVGDSPNLAELLSAGDDSGFEMASGNRVFEFPRDHASHPEYRNEWWYLTGNLNNAAGRRFGYELTLFRFALSSESIDAAANQWKTRDVFIGHFAITDVQAQTFHFAERFARNAAGLAGATAEPLRIWLYNWHLEGQQIPGEATAWRLRASDDEIAIELSLQPQKPVVLNGQGGLSRKSAEPGMASWYYSLPRLQTEGELTVAGERHAVSGLSWMDREFSSSALGADQQGWDWFALQLDDGSDLMFYQLRGTDGMPQASSAGTWIAADGHYDSLGADDFQLAVLDYWESPEGGRYPQGWQLSVPSLQMQLEIQPVMAEQELTTWVRYWEGAVDVRGTRANSEVSGRGYVELTGYANSVPTTPD